MGKIIADEWIKLADSDQPEIVYLVHTIDPRFIVEFEGEDGDVIAGTVNIPMKEAASWMRKAGDAFNAL